MQGNLNLNQSTNNNSDYARLADDVPPQPVFIDDTQSNYNQPQPYNQLPYAQNQGFNNQPQINQNQGFNNQPLNNQNQGFNNRIDRAHQRRCASKLKCMSLTVIFQNLFFIALDILFGEVKSNIVFIFMLIEVILFGKYLCQINNGTVSHQKFTQVRKTFKITSIMYTCYFIVAVIIWILLLKNDPHYETFIIFLVIQALIFLLPRFIGLCATKNVNPQPALFIANQ